MAKGVGGMKKMVVRGVSKSGPTRQQVQSKLQKGASTTKSGMSKGYGRA